MEDRDPDLELCRQAVHDARAFDRLRQKHRYLVRGAMRKQESTLKEEDLQDLDQCVWIAVNHSLPTFQGDSRFSTWLVGICRYVFLTWLRRQRAEQTALPRQQEDPTAPDADSRRWETVPGPSIETPVVESVVIEEALKKLREKERLVIHFRYTEQLTDTEVAERMDLSLGTVKSHIRAALRRLREDNDLREAFVKGMTT